MLLQFFLNYQNLNGKDLKGKVKKVILKYHNSKLNTLELSKISEFDQTGNLIKSVDYYHGEESDASIYKYDSRGNNIELIETYKGNIVRDRIYTYNSSNKLIKWEDFKDGSRVNLDTFIRNKSGQRVVDYYYVAEKLSLVTKYTYDKNNKICKEESIDEFGNIKSIDSFNYIYDIKGKVLIEKRFNEFGTEIYSYENEILRKKVEDYKSSYTERYYNLNGDEESTIGASDRTSSPSFNSITVYEYDSHGNWIKKKVTNLEPEEREIEYY